jgi:hypothetical protein
MLDYLYKLDYDDGNHSTKMSLPTKNVTAEEDPAEEAPAEEEAPVKEAPVKEAPADDLEPQEEQASLGKLPHFTDPESC